MYYSGEQLYQAFKERLIKELAVSSQELLYSAELFDTEDKTEEIDPDQK